MTTFSPPSREDGVDSVALPQWCESYGVMKLYFLGLTTACMPDAYAGYGPRAQIVSRVRLGRVKFKPPIPLEPELGRELITAPMRSKLELTGFCSRGSKKAGMQILERPRNVLLRGLYGGVCEQSTGRSAEAKKEASSCFPGLRAPCFRRRSGMHSYDRERPGRW